MLLAAKVAALGRLSVDVKCCWNPVQSCTDGLCFSPGSSFLQPPDTSTSSSVTHGWSRSDILHSLLLGQLTEKS